MDGNKVSHLSIYIFDGIKHQPILATLLEIVLIGKKCYFIFVQMIYNGFKDKIFFREIHTSKNGVSFKITTTITITLARFS